MSASGQTQTLPRGNKATKSPVQDKIMMPRLDNGGFGFPPRFDGGGGGGGGGNLAGGFILFGFLLLMGFLKELEKSWIAKRANKPYENERVAVLDHLRGRTFCNLYCFGSSSSYSSFATNQI